MLPLLHFPGDGRERALHEAVEAISDEFQLTAEDRQQLLPSGTSTVIGSRVGWARTYMKKAGLLEATKRGYIRLTERGLNLLKQNPKRRDQSPVPASDGLEATPEEVAASEMMIKTSKLTTTESTESSTKIGLAWILSIFKPSGGKGA